MKSQPLKNKIKKLNIPDQPGVYLFTIKGKIAYIGRATSLKDRTKSYFSSDIVETRGKLIEDMVESVNGLKWQTTDTVLEAIILEASLIKKYKPYYNTKEKDDKSFNYLVISDEEFPVLSIVRARDLEETKTKIKIKYEFGPFPSRTVLEEALKIVRHIFPFRDLKCKALSMRACFNYHLGLCPGVCLGKITKEDYSKNIRKIVLIFQGKKNVLLKNLEKEMKAFSKSGNFEEAGIVRDQIFALKHIKDVALIKRDLTSNNGFAKTVRIEAYDTAHLGGKDARGVMVVFEEGIAKKSDYRVFKIKEAKLGDDIGALTEILNRRKNHDEWSKPDVVVIDGGETHLDFAKKALNGYLEESKIISVVKDDKHRQRGILGMNSEFEKYRETILKANLEAHRFSVAKHTKARNTFFKRNFL
jgi:excinuclease ABC subunit C